MGKFVAVFLDVIDVGRKVNMFSKVFFGRVKTVLPKQAIKEEKRTLYQKHADGWLQHLLPSLQYSTP